MQLEHTLIEHQQQRICAKTDTLVRLASTHYSLRLPPIPVSFDLSGKAWGYYLHKNRQRIIRYNPWLFARYFNEGLNDTVPHEVAHYVVDMRFRRRCKPHGPEWREVMQFFGIQTPRATATTSLEGIPVRKQQRHLYSCGCQTHEISTTRHYRIERGLRYQCRLCGGYLRKAPLRDDI